MKKTSVIVASIFAALILIFLVLISLLKFNVIGNYGKEEPKEPEPIIVDNNILNCTGSLYDEEYQTDKQITALMTFANGQLTNMSLNYIYQYSDLEKFNNIFPNSRDVTQNVVVNGMAMTPTLNRDSYMYALNMNATLSELMQNEWSFREGQTITDFSYQTMLQNAQAEGLICN